MGISADTAAECRYTDPQAQKLKGVSTTASAVEMAVSETDSSTLALASELMKLEMLPPGQEATRIMPRPIMGEIHPVSAMASRQVNAGRSTSWHRMPSSTLLGFLNTSTKMAGLMPSETPYMTSARIILMVFMPPALRLT